MAKFFVRFNCPLPKVLNRAEFPFVDNAENHDLPNEFFWDGHSMKVAVLVDVPEASTVDEAIQLGIDQKAFERLTELDDSLPTGRYEKDWHLKNET